MESKRKRIILNWMSPANYYRPSPALSILKSYLNKHQFKVEIEYWNIRFMQLQYDFKWGLLNSEENSFDILLFFNYLAIYKKDHRAYEKVKAELKILQPQLINVSASYFDDHMKLYAVKVDSLFDEVIKTYDFKNILYFGFEANLYQWIASSILAEKIKKTSPSSITIVGGIGTKDAAEAFLINFPQFDIAMWGEGELPLLYLSNIIRDNQLQNISSIPNIVYRKGETIKKSVIPNRQYNDLSSGMIPDFSDYFNQAKKNNLPKKKLTIPIEGSRGCHWRRCHFCYLNTGYKFRVKTIDSLQAELETVLEKYGINSFMFLDNDLIVNDFERFEQLLDVIIKLKNRYPQISINSAEIITKGITSALVKKMAIAGFRFVQIGYESPSDSLLKKIDKKNTFSSNLSFIKFAQKFDITILGANIIQSLMEETDEDILEAIENLHFLRFYYKDHFFYHNISRLAITKASPYYIGLQGKTEYFQIDPIATLLPKDYINDETKISIFEYSSTYFNGLWSKFGAIEENYKQHEYSYILYHINDKIIYKEFYDKALINSLEFESASIEWLILGFANDAVISSSMLLDKCRYYYDVTLNDIIECINRLSAERLLYHSANYSENITVIDVDSVR